MPPQALLPSTLALVDDDATFSEYLSPVLQARGIDVRWFPTVEDLLTDEQAFNYGFYILDLVLPALDGLSLLRMLRRRSDVGVLVVTGKAATDLFDQTIGAGADMYLAKPVTFEQVLLGVSSVHRRVAAMAAPVHPWRLDAGRRQLIAPGGATVDLSPTDLSVLQCLLGAEGNTVSREALAKSLGWSQIDDPNLLHATMYRLRRRIGQATEAVAPLQSKSRLGYVFRAPLVAV